MERFLTRKSSMPTPVLQLQIAERKAAWPNAPICPEVPQALLLGNAAKCDSYRKGNYGRRSFAQSLKSNVGCLNESRFVDKK